MKGCSVVFLKVILFSIPMCVLSILMQIGNPNASLIGYLCTLLLCLFLYRYLIRKQQTRYQPMSENPENLPNFSEMQLATACIADILRTHTANNRRLIAKKTILLRVIYTAVFLVLSYCLISKGYYQPKTVSTCAVLTVVYTLLFYSANTLSVLARFAKAHPYTDFDSLIQANTFDDFDSPVCKKLTVLGIGAFLLSWVFVFALNSTPKWEYTAIDGGYAVTKYRPAITEMTKVEIPARYEGASVIAVGEKAFFNQGYLNTVRMTDSVLYIEKQAFSNCSVLQTVRLSNHLQRIGVGAFSECHRLQSIELPDTLTELLAESFKNCLNLKEIRIPEGVTEIRANAFDGCESLKTVVLHDGIIDIHAYAFQGCKSLVQINLPSGIKEIHTYTFANCRALKVIDIPNGVTRVAAHAFSGCTHLSYVEIPLSVKEIRSSAFRECTRLKEVTVAKDTVIDERAFIGSKTTISRSPLTTAQWNMVTEEISAKELSTFYYVVNDNNPGEPVMFHENIMFLTDNTAYAAQLKEGCRLQEIPDEASLTQILEAGRSSGATTVQVCVFSPLGTQMAGEDFFVYLTYDISEVLD